MKRTAVALTGGLALAVTVAGPALADNHESSVSVLHGVPGLTVDVYVNGEEAIPDFAPGTLTDPMTMAAGTYDIAVYPDGADPEADEPAISAEGLEVPGGANLTLVAHLAADGTPTLSAFANDTSQLEAGEARLTVRHAAAAPAVDVRAGGEAVIQALENPNEEVLDLSAGTVSADVVAAGTDTVVLGPADLTLTEGTNTIVYAWGSLDEDTLDLAVQTVDGLHGDPGGVPSGEAGLMGTSTAALWVLAAAGAGGVALAGRRLATNR
ncbi:DUF4397 domain-containing protein [Ornithinimicrobium sufpigmenti]|uniref:DUF4397 domain-containing protein n=1 Tax=Ornithinimicrobium sufpigmenti TaxID=2508882 RepID=UPI0010360227|nr:MULTISPECIES: DUF4397 domain-containing protein [unclassified Ornithinimicrobium]